jgi:ketosteroid isomerase-like protein
MNRIPLSFLFLALAALAGCALPRLDATGESTEADLRSTISRFRDLSGQGDLEGVMAQFDDGAEFILIGSDKGEVFKGREAVRAWLGTLCKANGFSWEIERIEIGRHEDTAWAFVEGKMVVRAKRTGEVRLSTPYRSPRCLSDMAIGGCGDYSTALFQAKSRPVS